VTAGAELTGSAARGLRFGLCAMLCLAVLSCGDHNGDGGNNTQYYGGGTGSASSSGSTGSPGYFGTTTTTTSTGNVVDVSVNAGPSAPSSFAVNVLYTTVTVCVPGSTTACTTIDHILVDTGSYGLRIISSSLGTVSLPLQNASDGNSLLECAQFVDGFSWGPVATADVQISGETARSVPVQVIGSSFAVPSDCSSIGAAENTVAEFGANGILGVGVFPQDCGATCVSNADNELYYECSSTQCQSTTVAAADEVANPVTLFAKDNNGVIITLPSVSAAGAATVTGTMIFGIDTQSNNAAGGQTIITLNGYGNFTTAFNGRSLKQSFLDTGSNGLFFPDTSLTTCTEDANFYCPSSEQAFTATLTGQNGSSSNVSFSVADAETLDVMSLAAFVNLAGPYPTTTDPGSSATGTFDWGLPFYFGKTVYTAFYGAATSVGSGPYVAF
jgi:hypothetical protein